MGWVNALCEQVGQHVDELVRSTEEEGLKAMPDARADAAFQAKRYERIPDRVAARSET